MSEYDPLKDQNVSTFYRHDADGQLVPSFEVRSPSAGIWPTGTESYGPNDREQYMVPPIEKRIASLETDLAQVRGHDPRTGEAIYAFSDTRRRAMQMELEMLKFHTLPRVREQARLAEEWHARQPSLEDTLRAQKDRQDDFNDAVEKERLRQKVAAHVAASGK